MKRIAIAIALTLLWLSAPGFAADPVSPQKRANILLQRVAEKLKAPKPTPPSSESKTDT